MKRSTWRAVLLFTLASASSPAQTAPTWTQKSPATAPPAEAYDAIAFDSAHGQAAMFSWDTKSPFANITWLWDGYNWTKKSPQTGPPTRFSYALAFDAARGQVVLYGGRGGSGDLNDTWVWDGSNWTQKFPQNSPPPMHSHAMAYDSAHAQVVLFGSDGVTYLWDGSNWTHKSPAPSPPGRTASAMAYDSAHGQVVLYGGFFSLDYSGDTWLWDGSNWTQKSLQVSPPARAFHAMAYDAAHGQVVMYGGATPTFNLADTWLWDGSAWTSPNSANHPLARWGHVMAYDSAHGQIVLFGGSLTVYGDPNPILRSDTWVWPADNASAPAINAVISAGAFGAFSTAAPGSWVEIYGSNLANSSRQWTGADFTGSTAPTSLDGVKVTIGNQPAFIDFIRADQVNALLPSGISPGSTQVTVTNGNQTSPPFNMTINSVQPGLLAPSSFKLNGNQYVVATLADGVTYILPPGSIAGVNSRQAKPGETIVIYGIGFGSVTPNIAVGQIVSQSNQLSQPFQLMFGPTQAQLSYYGLAPNYVGLYQFNVMVPSAPDSDLVPLTFSVAGIPGTQTLYTAVHR